LLKYNMYFIITPKNLYFSNKQIIKKDNNND
jgi:hypothetical protein